MTPPFPILYEDNHLLVINKPAGLPTMGVSADRPSALSLAKEYVKRKYNKPGNVYLGVVSRLDTPTTGILLLARTSKGAGRLSEQFRRRQVEKVYWAVVEEPLAEPAGRLEDYLQRDPRHRSVHVVPPAAQGSQQAVLHYQWLCHASGGELLEVRLETGRKHQIRVQLAARERPIIGDRKYGSQRPFSVGIALHCRQLKFAHPVGKGPLEFTAPLPESWKPFGLDVRLNRRGQLY